MNTNEQFDPEWFLNNTPRQATPTRAQKRAAERAYVKNISKEIFRLRKHNLSKAKSISSEAGQNQQ
jgi:hypothetical protein